MSRMWAVCNSANGQIVSTMRMNSEDLSDNDDYLEGYFVKDITDEGNPETLINTKYWDGQWVDLPPKPEGEYKLHNGEWVFDEQQFLAVLRADRNIKLAATDWTQLFDSPLTAAEKQAWANYRQSLRDLPSSLTNVTDLQQVSWPAEPAN